jgi:DNA sulfur modification protein DndB
MTKTQKFPPLILPGLRGNFGSWIYYACLIPIEEVARRVEYATAIHTSNKPLSDLIQRSLEGPRATKIAGYLQNNDDRFFSSLVLAVYGGAPEWLEVGNLKATTRADLVKSISEQARDSIGFLSLSGREEILAVDGQHRVAGIKKAIAEKIDLEGEMVPVILIGHAATSAGLRRTRRLFTTLNKLAVPVSKKDIIALDEDDVMAITARRLVEEHPKFKGDHIAITTSQQIPASNEVSLTTIGNLYDILKLVFMHIAKRRDDQLRFNRPTDAKLELYFQAAVEYFVALEAIAPPLKEYFDAAVARVAKRQRSSSGGHLLFRPIGLEIATRASISLAKVNNLSLDNAIAKLAKLPMQLNASPFRDVIWDPARKTIITKGKSIAVRLVVHMLDSGKTDPHLLTDLCRFRGVDSDDTSVKLPAKL